MANMYANNSQAIQRRRRLTNTAADLSGFSVPGLATPPTGALARASNEMAREGMRIYRNDQDWRKQLYQAGLDAAAKADDMDYRNAQLEQARQNAQMQDMATRRGQDYASREAALNRRQGLRREQMGIDADNRREAMRQRISADERNYNRGWERYKFGAEMEKKQSDALATKEYRDTVTGDRRSYYADKLREEQKQFAYEKLQEINDIVVKNSDDEAAKKSELALWERTYGGLFADDLNMHGGNYQPQQSQLPPLPDGFFGDVEY